MLQKYNKKISYQNITLLKIKCHLKTTVFEVCLTVSLVVMKENYNFLYVYFISKIVNKRDTLLVKRAINVNKIPLYITTVFFNTILILSNLWDAHVYAMCPVTNLLAFCMYLLMLRPLFFVFQCF